MFGEPSMEDNVIGISNLDQPIYRIFSTHWFEHLINTDKNGLVHPSSWDDPFENFFLKNEAELQDGTTVSLAQLSRSWYGQCWTRNVDSDAMWRIYSPNKDGIRVRTTIRDLFSDFYDPSDKFASLKFLIGSVEYQSRSKIEQFLASTTFNDLALGGQPHRFADTLLIKRPEFQHENEVRLLFHDTEGTHANGNVAVFSLGWRKIFSEVALDPRLTDIEYDQLKQRLLSLGCTVPIVQSELYKFTPAKVRFE